MGDNDPGLLGMTPLTQAVRPESSDRAVDAILGDDVDFGRYVVAIWSRLWLIVLVGILCAAAAAAMVSLRPSLYRASAMLAVSGSKIGEQAAPSVSAANFRPLIESPSVAATVIEELQLSVQPHGLTKESFLGALTSEEVRNSNLIRVEVTLRDPSLAAQAANRVSELAVERARALSQNEAVQARDDIKVEVDQARKQMMDASARLGEFRTAAQIELTKEDVGAILRERGKLPELQLDIETERGRLARAVAELELRKRTDSLTRSVVGDAALAQAAKSGLSSSGLGLQLESEEVNKAYEWLEQTVAESRTTLAAFERRRTRLGALQLDAKEQSKLTELYRKEAELSRLQTEYAVAEKSYTEIAARYDVARLQVASRSSQLQLVDRAIVPSAPTPRHLLRESAFAFLAGGTLMAVLVLLSQALHDVLSRAGRGSQKI